MKILNSLLTLTLCFAGVQAAKDDPKKRPDKLSRGHQTKRSSQIYEEAFRRNDNLRRRANTSQNAFITPSINVPSINVPSINDIRNINRSIEEQIGQETEQNQEHYKTIQKRLDKLDNKHQKPKK